MKKITEFSVKYPVTVLMMVLAIILLGVISFGRLGVDLFPDMNNPKIFVEIKAGQKPPEEIEKQYVINIESMAIRQSDVVNVSSVSKVGSAQITVEYSWDKDMDEAFLDLQKALSIYSQNEDIDEFVITQHDPNASPIIQVALTHENIDDLDELRKTAENYIRNELIRLEGIADVQLSGVVETEISIETNPYLLEAYGLQTSTIASQIENYNRNVSGGSIVEYGTKYLIKGVSMINELQDLRELIVGYVQTGTEAEGNVERAPVFLSDVADVQIAVKDPTNIVRFNQERCIGMSVYKEPRFNTVMAVENLNAEFEDLKKSLPGYQFTIVQNQGEYISNAIDEVETTALYGIILAVFVLFVFLRRLGTTLVISIAIPISIIATFNLMYFNDLTLNIMTLSGLALGAGMLVDNAIVVMENIYRKIEEGMSVRDAAIHGTAEVGGAITASTITTIVVFLPIVYLHGASGELFKDQAWTVAFSLVSSLFVAILFIPVLVNFFFKKKVKVAGGLQFKGYGPMLEKIIKARWAVILGATLLIGLAVVMVPVIGSEFMPGANVGEFTMEVKLPEGTSIERTASTVRNIEEMVKGSLGSNIAMIYSHIGIDDAESAEQESVFQNENTAKIKIVLNREENVSSDRVIEAIEKMLADREQMEIRFIKDETALNSTLGTEEEPLVVEVRGEELDEIERLTAQVTEVMRNAENLYNVKSSMEDGSPEIEVVVDKYRAGMYNLTPANVVSQIQSYLNGMSAGEIEREGELKDITIKLPKLSPDELSGIIITGGLQEVRLADIASLESAVSPRQIFRNNQIRTGKVTAQVSEEIPFDRIVANLETNLDEIVLPNNYRIVITGDELKREETVSSLSFALIISIILVYMVMASQFESLVHPFTILLTIPLAGVGAVLTFFFLGTPLNMMAIIGIIMLIGIAVNDSIILVDAINQFRKEGMELTQSIIEAGKNRIRPIIMTSLTTILALAPLTIGIGESAELRSSMAWAVIGGLVTSTILTLIVIPCVYYVFDSMVRGKQNTTLKA